MMINASPLSAYPNYSASYSPSYGTTYAPTWQTAQTPSYTAPSSAYPYYSAGYASNYAWPTAQNWLAARPLTATQRVLSKPVEKPWVNNLKPMFQTRQAVVYALHVRTFAAEDKNGDGKIDPKLGENGTFLKAIKRLPELKALGVNTIHLLPINPVGKIDRLGEFGSPGSAYSPAALDELNPEYAEGFKSENVVKEARQFVDEAHKLGINVMVDIPSCGSIDLAKKHPELFAKDQHGNFMTPTNWIDIRMFVRDSMALRDYYQKFFDLMVDKVGVDGFRADIARARTMGFWKHFIKQYPDKAWLAETYTEEDASPMQNIPRDLPEDLLKAGFDSIYGQYHIFHDMNAQQYHQYVGEMRDMIARTGPGKSLIGSFLTHDDPSTMEQGGSLYNKVIAGLMATQPDTNPYILDGFTTGYREHYNIFDYKPPVKGKHPDIGLFLKRMLELRRSEEFGKVLTVGNYVPVRIEQNANDPRVVAFLRQHGDKTVLIVANKDVNASHKVTLEIPGLNPRQTLANLAPSYGEESSFLINTGQIEANLARGRFYMFDIQLPKLNG